MDRDAIAREQRRRQANEALEYERERLSTLEDQVDAVVAELEGSRIDEEAFGRMAPEDVDLVRDALGLGPFEGPKEEEEWLVEEGLLPEVDPEAERAEAEAEIARLHEEIAACRRRQEALERYIEALATDPLQGQS